MRTTEFSALPPYRPRAPKGRVSGLWLATLAFFFVLPAAGGELDRRAGWSVAAGRFNIDDSDTSVFEAGVEYRFAPPKAMGAFALKPVVGVSANDDEAFWAYGGLRLDYAFSRHWVISPMLGATLYEDGDSRDLGGAFHFRSGLELSYRFASGRRLGLTFYHLSNAGLDDRNPGSNSLVLTLSF